MSMERKEGGLCGALAAYGDSDAYPFHMPGHKRNPEFMALPPVNRIDITEIDGFDNLHHAEGILQSAQERAAKVRGADRTWFLVNGSTAGLLSAISACTRRGGRILVARNCHKSVYNAIELLGLRPVYIYPKLHQRYGIYEAVAAKQVEELLESYEGIEAVVVTSPTYEGVISDIEGIAKVAHRYGLPLIVDSAHGAHLGYHGHFAPSPVALGADLVIESLHKTLPSMTQTALIHRCGTRVNDGRLQKYLAMYQTSSPSYVMMASMDQCMALLEAQAAPLFEAYSRRLRALRRRLEALVEEAGSAKTQSASSEAASAPEKLCVASAALAVPDECRGAESPASRPYIRLLGASELCQVKGSSYDDSKLVLFVENGRGMGQWLYDRLREDYHLQMEMASADYVLAMTTICDTDEGFGRLLDAVTQLNARLAAGVHRAAENAEISPWDDMAAVPDTLLATAAGNNAGAGAPQSASQNPVPGSASDNANAAGHFIAAAAPDPSAPGACTAAKIAALSAADALSFVGAVTPELSIAEAASLPVQSVAREAACGRISGSYLYIYPPGVPFCVPGERITEKTLALIDAYEGAGLKVLGLDAGAVSCCIGYEEPEE